MFKSVINKMQVKANNLLSAVIKNERGDTNFISILIILGIVILLAGIFIGFKNQIVEMVGNIINNFTIS